MFGGIVVRRVAGRESSNHGGRPPGARGEALIRFELIEHTADTGIRAYGSSLGEVFENCALGMVSLMMDPGSVDPAQSVSIEASAMDLKALLVGWLSEILFEVEAGGWAFNAFSVSEISETRVVGAGRGEPLDPQKHGVKEEIKAATYHMLEIDRQDGGWAAQVIFDV